jgi:hypothetical protein
LTRELEDKKINIATIDQETASPEQEEALSDIRRMPSVKEDNFWKYGQEHRSDLSESEIKIWEKINHARISQSSQQSDIAFIRDQLENNAVFDASKGERQTIFAVGEGGAITKHTIRVSAGTSTQKSPLTISNTPVTPIAQPRSSPSEAPSIQPKEARDFGARSLIITTFAIIFTLIALGGLLYLARRSS